MASDKTACQDERAGAEIVYGAEECYSHSLELLKELGFPMGVLALKDLEECGCVRDTGFVWMKQKAPYEHYFVATKTLDPAQNKIYFKTPIGIGKSFPLTAFMTDEEKEKYLEKAN
uniref:Uncharacterized protein n=1 Tax=Solanum lycopersicum TaxID=4081 RepID=A0A3Q7HX46_SOLLC